MTIFTYWCEMNHVVHHSTETLNNYKKLYTVLSRLGVLPFVHVVF